MGRGKERKERVQCKRYGSGQKDAWTGSGPRVVAISLTVLYQCVSLKQDRLHAGLNAETRIIVLPVDTQLCDETV